MQALHEAISALSLQLFNFSFKWNTAEVSKCYLGLTHHLSYCMERLQITVLCFLFTVKIQRFRWTAWGIS